MVRPECISKPSWTQLPDALHGELSDRRLVAPRCESGVSGVSRQSNPLPTYALICLDYTVATYSLSASPNRARYHAQPHPLDSRFAVNRVGEVGTPDCLRSSFPPMRVLAPLVGGVLHGPTRLPPLHTALPICSCPVPDFPFATLVGTLARLSAPHQFARHHPTHFCKIASRPHVGLKPLPARAIFPPPVSTSSTDTPCPVACPLSILKRLQTR